MIREAGFNVDSCSLDKVTKSDPANRFIQCYYYFPTLIASFEDSDPVSLPLSFTNLIYDRVRRHQMVLRF